MPTFPGSRVLFICMCRNRQPFFVERDGKGTYIPLYTEIRGNFFINDINAQEAVDNDDNSAYYETHHNFLPFSSAGLKSDFGGHDNHHHHNMYINTDTCMNIVAQFPGHNDAFYNNTCVIYSNSSNYVSFEVKGSGDSLPVMHDNRVYTLDGNAKENGDTIAAWQAKGVDLGTTVALIPSEDELVSMARDLLNMQ